MFDRIFTMMAGGELDELPRGPRGQIVYDRAMGAFVDEPPPARPATGYLGRGDVPGGRPAPAPAPTPPAAAAHTPGSRALVDELLSMARDDEDPIS